MVQFRRKIAPYLFVNSVIVLFTLVRQQRLLLRHGALEHLHRVQVREALERRLRLARRVQAAAREGAHGGDRGGGGVRPRASSIRRRARACATRAAAQGRRANGAARRSRPASTVAVAGACVVRRDAAQPAPPGDRVRQALSDRDEILRRAQRPAQVAARAARRRGALGDGARRQGAGARARLRRGRAAGSRRRRATQLEGEITTLENAANPLERGSEDRVRRLAYLKRQRRALVDAAQRKDALSAKLETCALALQNMRFDLMRLGASPQMHQHITSLANQAMKLTENVDDALFVADEMGRADSRAVRRRRDAPRSAGDRSPARPPRRRGRHPVPRRRGDRARRHGRRLSRRATCGSTGASRSRCCLPSSRSTPTCASASSARRRPSAQLAHPGIVPIYTVDEAEGLVFFVMALVDGETLGERLLRERRLAAGQVRRILHRRRRRARLRACTRRGASRHQAGQHHARARAPGAPW